MLVPLGGDSEASDYYLELNGVPILVRPRTRNRCLEAVPCVGSQSHHSGVSGTVLTFSKRFPTVSKIGKRYMTLGLRFIFIWIRDRRLRLRRGDDTNIWS